VYNILVGKPQGKRAFWRHRRRWEDNIKMDGCEEMDCTERTRDTVQWEAFVNTFMNLRILQKAGNFLTD
jgi:hypothetical protein